MDLITSGPNVSPDDINTYMNSFMQKVLFQDISLSKAYSREKLIKKIKACLRKKSE